MDSYLFIDASIHCHSLSSSFGHSYLVFVLSFCFICFLFSEFHFPFLFLCCVRSFLSTFLPFFLCIFLLFILYSLQSIIISLSLRHFLPVHFTPFSSFRHLTFLFLSPSSYSLHLVPSSTSLLFSSSSSRFLPPDTQLFLLLHFSRFSFFLSFPYCIIYFCFILVSICF